MHGFPPMATAGEMKDPVWVQKLKLGGAVNLRDVEECRNGWSSPPGNIFQVRSANYLDSKQKTPGGDWLLKPLAFDWIKSSSKITNVMLHPNGRVRATAEEVRKQQEHGTPFIWVINLQVPSKDNHSLIMYYYTFDPPEKDSLMQRFLDGDTGFRNSRLKLLANVVKGPWIVKTAVGDRGVCLLGKAVSASYTRGDNFMEIDVDIGSSMMANAIVHLAFGNVTSLTVDLAFVLEGQTSNELPERILGAIRFANLDPAAASCLDAPLPMREEVKSLSSRLWRSFSSLLHGAHPDPVANVEDDDDEADFQDAKSSL